MQFANGELNYEYTYNLPYFGPAALGNKVDNLFKLYVKTKSKDAQAFPAQFQHLDDVVWSYTCIAKPTVNLGGQGGITTGGNNAPAPGPAFQAQPASPPPPPAPGFKVMPQAPQPPAAPRRVTP